ncbi:MAG: alkaline phosphatase family protein, partial [Caldilineaceae bacterium]|nr:alkaline phosphatase family protein [Caldilineaceae bacterium]
VTPMMKYFVAQGVLPNFARMLRSGTVNQTYPSFPVWTPTNWATLSTGAHTGTHGVTTWSVETAPGQRINSFSGQANNAERIWNALERAGMKGVALHYPAAYPSGMRASYAIDGFGAPGHKSTDFEIASCQAYANYQTNAAVAMGHDGSAQEGQQSVTRIPALQPATDWANLPNSHRQPLASQIEIEARLGGDINRLQLLVIDSSGNGYDHILLCRQTDGNSEIARAAVGQWSTWAIEEFQIAGRRQRAAVRFKLLELSPTGDRIKLYRSQVTYTDGFTYGDDELVAELIERFGPYQEHASTIPYSSGMTDFDTALEECEYQGLWFADVANYMLYEKDCTYFTCHWHLYDYLNHIHLNNVDPVCPGYDESTAEAALDLFRKAYQVGDRVLGRLYAAADAHPEHESFVGILADHGAYPDIRIANIRKFLYDQGFLVLKSGPAGVAQDQDTLPDDVDWEKTRAYIKRRGFDIAINAEAGSAEFNEIERDLLTALRTWVDEETGRTPVAIALPRRDAYLLGQWGDQCGDVIFAWDHGYVSGYYAQWQEIVGGGSVGAPAVYGAHHGGFLPTDNGFSSTFGTMMLSGPGIKAGYERPTDQLGYIQAVDVVPTFCHLLEIEPPAQSQGAVARDLFDGQEMVRNR